MMWNKLFELRGDLPKKIRLTCEVIGISLILLLWYAVTDGYHIVPAGIFPSPVKIISSLNELYYQDAVVLNLIQSFKLNVFGALEAVLVAIPIGFAIGLFPVLRSVFLRYVVSVRFLPLSALVGVFIVIFGIDSAMKMQFLAFSVFIYLLPAVIRRIDEVEQVYTQTTYTLGATKWQTIRLVFIPNVLSKVYEDIRDLAALSWTYIIIAEMVNASGGGIGALAFKASRQARIDKVFMILILIVGVGILMDAVMQLFGQIIFPYKVKKG